MKNGFVFLCATIALSSLAGCGGVGNVVSGVTGVEVEPIYSAQQKEALRASLTLSLSALTNGQASLTEAEWQDTFKKAEVLCQYLDDHSREDTIRFLTEGWLEQTPDADEFTMRQLSEGYVLAATAQGSYCPQGG